jgi:hypothetical protein
MNISLFEAPGQMINPTFQPISSRNSSNSWGIGPEIGFDAKCLFPRGFRIQGGGSGALLYTTFTSVNHSEDVASTLFNTGPYTASYTDYRAMCPNTSLDVGVGFGRYVANSRAHFDLSFTYLFSIYWEQNMMRKLLDDISTNAAPTAPNLLTQGLSITCRIDF